MKTRNPGNQGLTVREWRRCAMIRLLGFSLLAVTVAAHADEPQLPSKEPAGQVETMATFDGPMPTGVTVSREGRIFVNFPRWGDAVEFTVAELKGAKPVPYPDAVFNRLNKDRPTDSLVSVQSVVVDPDNRLWLLDTGSTEFGPTLPGGPKLVGVDLKTNKVFKTIRFPREVALETTYLNDIRFDLRRGKGGVAYITDSSLKGPNGLIIVDLATGQSRRRLNGHPFTKPDPQFLPIVEGRPLMNRPPGGKPAHMTFGSDGIAIAHDGKHLYYCPLSSRRLYLTDYEDNAILRRNADGGYDTLAHDPRLLWPDTLSVAADEYLYIIANQLHRQAQFHGSEDSRRKPYALFRIRIDAQPVLLR